MGECVYAAKDKACRQKQASINGRCSNSMYRVHKKLLQTFTYECRVIKILVTTGTLPFKASVNQQVSN